MRILVLCVSILLLTACGDNVSQPQTIGDYIRHDSRLEQVESLLRSAGKLAALDEPGEQTFFAFQDSSMELELLEQEELAKLLDYHRVNGRSLGLSELQGLTALQADSDQGIHVRYRLDGLFLNDGSQVLEESIVAENGILHILDFAMLRPIQTEAYSMQAAPEIPFQEFFSESDIRSTTQGWLHDIEVEVNIEHQFPENLEVFLSHEESEIFIPLASRRAGPIRTMKGRFADHAELGIYEATGEEDKAVFRPGQPLESLSGISAAGTWSLIVIDYSQYNESPGVFKSWSMHTVVGAEKPKPTLVLNQSEIGNIVLGKGFDERISVSGWSTGEELRSYEFVGEIDDLAIRSFGPEVRGRGVSGSIVVTVPKDMEAGSLAGYVGLRAGDTSRLSPISAKAVEPIALGMELVAQVALPDLGEPLLGGNDIWGWTDPESGKEYAIMGTASGTAFVDMSSPAAPVVTGILPTRTTSSLWRDVKVYDNHAFIVSEAEDHGLQVFDLRLLRTTEPGTTLSASATDAGFGNAHNIAIHEEDATAYIVGSDLEGCNGGMLVYDISQPLSPTAIACFSGATNNTQTLGPSYPTDVYTHDVQCVTYAGPDLDYQGESICVSSDESTIGIANFSDPNSPVQIVRMPYQNVGYAHQGWFTEDHRFFLSNDEFDEVSSQLPTTTYVWDLSDLDNPILLDPLENPTKAVGHNAYVASSTLYQANYTSGLRLVDVAGLDVGQSEEYAFYDTYPDDDECETGGSCAQGFDGAWSTYPFFDSGLIVVSDTERGLFILRPTP